MSAHSAVLYPTPRIDLSPLLYGAKLLDGQALANSVYPDQTASREESDQGLHCLPFEPRSGKTGLQGFRTGLTQTRLYTHRRWLEA